MRLKRRADDGAVAILVAVLATVLFAFAAIVVDLGYARTVQGDAQSTVDAASLAGAGILSTDSSPSAITRAYTAIKASALANFGTTAADWDACSATPPTSRWRQGGSNTNCILFNNGANNPSKLQVVLPAKHVDSFFGGLIGYGGMDINVQAQATIRGDAVPGCALCVQGLLDTSGDIAVDGGIAGGSSSATSGHVGAGGHIIVQDPGAITFVDTPDPAKGPAYSPRPVIRPVTDPFVGSLLPRGDPPMLAPFPDPAPGRNVTCGPGDVLPEATYRNIVVTAPASDPCTATGVIVVTRLLRVRGYLSGVSATIQLSCGTRTAPAECAPATNGGSLQIDADGQINMIASATEFSVVADPDNRSTMTINGQLAVDQAIYGRSTPVRLGPGAGVTTSGRISVAELTIGSGGSVDVTAAGGAAVPGPPFVGLYR